MSNATWFLDIEPKVFTLIKGKTYTKLKQKYPGILFTTIDAMPTDSTFSHTVYIHEVGGLEMGKDLEGNSVNAYECTMEVKVSVTSEDSNSKKTEVREITKYIASAFKQLRFEIVLMPTVEITDSAYTVPMRFRRVIGANDTL